MPRSVVPVVLLGFIALGHLSACAPEERAPQLEALSRWEDRRLAPIDSLTAMISGPDAVVRRAALRTAGLIGRTDALPAMISALNDRSQAVRAQAAFSLGLLGGDVAVPPLHEAVADHHQAVRVAAIEGLAHQRHDGSALYSLAVHGSEREATAAWTALRNVAAQADRDSLVAAIRAGLARPEPEVRWRVLRCAELAADTTLIAQIAPYATDREVQVRVHALRALGRQQGDQAVAAVLRSAERHGRLRGFDLRRVRVAEQRALGNLSTPLLAAAPEADHNSLAGRAAAVLVDGAHAPDAQVAEVALTAMAAVVADLPLPVAAERQESLLPVWRIRMQRAARARVDDPAPAVRGSALAALGALRGRGALDVLQRGLQDDDATVVGAAAAALVGLDPNGENLLRLLQRTRDLDHRAFAQTLDALASRWPGTAPLDTVPDQCRASHGQSMATAALASPHLAVRATAARLLGRFPGAPASHALTRAYRRADRFGAAAAEERLEIIGAWSHLYRAIAAGAPQRAPGCQGRDYLASVDQARALGARDPLGEVVHVEEAHRQEVAALLQAAFDQPDLRVRLAARECAEGTGLLPAELIPTAASLRETLPAHVRHPDQPAVRRPFEAPDIRVVTDRGAFTIRLATDVAPSTCAAFLQLARDGFHDGSSFHRVVADFVIQGGCPDGDGWGGPGWTLRSEWSRRPFERGTVGLAHSGKDTGGSQWFVCHSAQPHLNGRYTVFGEVVDGLDVVDAIERGDGYRLEVIDR